MVVKGATGVITTHLKIGNQRDVDIGCDGKKPLLLWGRYWWHDTCQAIANTLTFVGSLIHCFHQQHDCPFKIEGIMPKRAPFAMRKHGG